MAEEETPRKESESGQQQIAEFRTIIMPKLSELGVEKITVHYSGSGDEGFIDGIDAEPEEVEVPQELNEKITDLAEEFLYAQHGSWGDGDGATGTVVIDVPRKKIVNEHGWCFTDVNFETKEF